MRKQYCHLANKIKRPRVSRFMLISEMLKWGDF